MYIKIKLMYFFLSCHILKGLQIILSIIYRNLHFDIVIEVVILAADVSVLASHKLV
jgi:hypothetical protein